MTPSFSYDKAFARNIGWVTEGEQAVVRGKRVAIAGMGGVGGEHLLTLTRLGIGRFKVADYDCFDIANLNRQAGASMATLGLPKSAVLAGMARNINPELDLDEWRVAVDASNIEGFLAGVDVYVDGLDFFAFDARAAVFAACRRLGIPAVTAAPLGMGTALLNFTPGSMSFEDYFGWGASSDDERALRFMIGLAPRLLQDYLVDESRVDLAARRGPSTAMACQLCAGVAATEVLKILLKRGRMCAAPHGLQFDAYRNKMVRTWRPWGYRNPLNQVMLMIARRRLAAMKQEAVK